MSYMSVDGSRNVRNHAGIEAKISVPFSYVAGTAGGKAQIVASPADGRKIKLHSYTWSGMGAAASLNLCSSAAAATPAASTLTGDLSSINGIPFFQGGDPLVGVCTCVVGEDLCVSGSQGGAGTVVYSLVP